MKETRMQGIQLSGEECFSQREGNYMPAMFKKYRTTEARAQ